MKERPILFSAPMVHAILAGTKTQTRRVAKTEITMGRDSILAPHRGKTHANVHLLPEHAAAAAACCPYGHPGDRLWVREAWAEVPRAEPRTDEDLPWRPDGRIVVYRAQPEWEGARTFLCADGVLRWAKPDRWRPSIHMPRWASRITLEITEVRVERLQEISDEDSLAEGIYPTSTGLYPGSPRAAYEKLWEQINGPGSWEANPWVWAVSFQRVEAA